MSVESAMFRVARDDAEKQICDKLKNKLDEFLELENYDWNLAEPQGHASGFITDLIAFLQSTFTCFTNLPVNVATRMQQHYMKIPKYKRELIVNVSGRSGSSGVQIRVLAHRKSHIGYIDQRGCEANFYGRVAAS